MVTITGGALSDIAVFRVYRQPAAPLASSQLVSIAIFSNLLRRDFQVRTIRVREK